MASRSISHFHYVNVDDAIDNTNDNDDDYDDSDDTDDKRGLLSIKFHPNNRNYRHSVSDNEYSRSDESRKLVAMRSLDKDGEANHQGDKSELIIPTDSDLAGKVRMSFCQIIALNMTYLGLNMMLLLLSVEVVPAQIEAIVGSAHKGLVLGLTVAFGAIVTFIIGPLVGMHSDRLVSRFGRRRPIIVVAVGILCTSCMFMVLIAPPINTVNPTINSTGCVVVNLTERRCANIQSKPSVPIHRKSLLESAIVSPASVNVTDVNISSRIYLYVPFYLVVISSYIAAITPYNALIADKSCADQRGLSSGAMGGMTLLGNIFGAALGLLIFPIGAVFTMVICLVILIISVGITVTHVAEVSTTTLPVQDTLTWRQQMTSFYRPLIDHDFRWLFLTRFLMQQGLTSLIGFLEYYVNDMLQLPLCWSSYKAVSFLLLPMLISAAISSIICGIVSDKTGRRKLILIVNSIIMASMSFVIIFLRGDKAYYISIFTAILFGIALGGYQSVDFALLMDILPGEKDKSLMIAVWHQAMVLPQALAVPVSGLIVDLLERVNCQIGLGYSVLMFVISVYFILGGCFITRIRTGSIF